MAGLLSRGASKKSLSLALAAPLIVTPAVSGDQQGLWRFCLKAACRRGVQSTQTPSIPVSTCLPLIAFAIGVMVSTAARRPAVLASQRQNDFDGYKQCWRGSCLPCNKRKLSPRYSHHRDFLKDFVSLP